MDYRSTYNFNNNLYIQIMTKFSLYFFLILMWCNFSNAETYDELEITAVKKLQNEYLSCYAFYSISESVFDDLEDENLKYIVAQKDLVLKSAMDIELSLIALKGEELLNDEKLFKNKIEPQLEEVFKQLWAQWKSDTDESLVSKRDNLCQEILNNPKSRIEYWIKKL